MELFEPAACTVDLARGVLDGAGGRYEKRLSDLAGLYEDEAAFAALLAVEDPVVYEVTDFRPSAHAGDLVFGMTRMAPGRVGREFFLTRGHLHARADRPEIYHGQSGRGLMLLESPAGETRTLSIGPGTIAYVPPFWIHRSVNLGDDHLVMVFCYPADAGQDYDVIARSGGMRHRVVAEGAGWALADNRGYRPRPPEAVAALLATAA